MEVNAILADPYAWTKVQFHFQLYILGWATIFVFSLNPTFGILMNVLDIHKNLNAILVDPNAWTKV